MTTDAARQKRGEYFKLAIDMLVSPGAPQFIDDYEFAVEAARLARKLRESDIITEPGDGA